MATAGTTGCPCCHGHPPSGGYLRPESSRLHPAHSGRVSCIRGSAMTDPDLRRQWPGWALAALVAAVIVCGTIASCLRADGT